MEKPDPSQRRTQCSLQPPELRSYSDPALDLKGLKGRTWLILGIGAMEKSNSNSAKDTTHLEHLAAEITADARGDDEELRAFHRALVEGVALPCDAFVIGEPVTLIAFDYDGNRRRGIVARVGARTVPSTWSRHRRS